MTGRAWSRDELILALALYHTEPKARGNQRHPSVIALSNLLNRIGEIGGRDMHSRFRNPNGVSMTLNTFLGFDAAYTGKGLRRTRLAEVVWNDFYDQRELLFETATAIRSTHEEVSQFSAQLRAIDPLEEALEGRILSILHTVRERNRTIVNRKKSSVLGQNGALACEVCGFDFKAAYGDHGAGFAECHHARPLSSYRSGERTELMDLRIVCANCHRMIHRSRPWLSIDQLKALVSNDQSETTVAFSSKQPSEVSPGPECVFHE